MPERSQKAWVRKHQPSYWSVWTGKAKKKDKDNDRSDHNAGGRHPPPGGQNQPDPFFEGDPHNQRT